MKSLYGQYILEREGFEIIENEHGFATFKIFENGECYLRDIFVLKEKRRGHLALDLSGQVEEIAKKRGAKYMTGTVSPHANNPTASIKAVLGAGYRLLSAGAEKIVFIKELI